MKTRRGQLFALVGASSAAQKSFSALPAFFVASVLLADVDPTYTALRAARPDGPAVAVQDLTIERDAFRFRFEKGTFQFLAPVDGRVTGAVFVGEDFAG